MLQPKKTKYRKTFRIKHDTHAATKGNRVSFGDFGLQATTSAWVSARQIESARRAITRRMGREGQVFIRIFPHMPKTSKPIGVRMGSGKGSVDQWLAVVRVATMMFEVSGVKDNIAKDALRLGGHKLPLQWKIVASSQKQEEGANATK